MSTSISEVDTFPYVCDFDETFCNWRQDHLDELDFYRWRGESLPGQQGFGSRLLYDHTLENCDHTLGEVELLILLIHSVTCIF